MITGARRISLGGRPALPSVLGFWSVRIGLVVLAAIVAIALIGPFVAPYGPTEIVGAPYTSPSGAHIFGTDFLGRDVLTRVLYGGRSLLGLSLAATVLAYSLGISIGLFAGAVRSWLDPLLMRSVDVILAFPPLIFLLIVATGTGRSILALVLAVAIVLAPGCARIVRSATQAVATRGFVEAAVARGERTSSLLVREIVPNIRDTLLADVGIRLTSAILLIAAVSFLGLGLQPPSSDWALMVSENRSGLTLQPWAVLIPALLIAALTVGVNLVGDGITRQTVGESSGDGAEQ